MKVTLNRIAFNYEILGKERAPWLVFSNSLMTNLSMWDAQVTTLLRDFRILRYDQRGHGGTDAPDGPYTFDTLVADVIALYDVLKIDKAHFVGLSMGGMTAVMLAKKHPERVAKIVACDCGPASSPQGAQQWDERVTLARAQGMEALTETTLARWFPEEFASRNPETIEKVRGMIRTTPVAGFAGCAAALSDFDLRPSLGALKPPALFVAGEKDAMLAGTKVLHAAVPGAGFAEIPGAGHICNIEQPDMFTRAVADFLLA